ncbi:hypothetical protein PV_020 (endogenous virus) [Gutovirus Vc1]|uniref:Uncharacterized protein n=1 Tax=Vibrio phage Vc1 TaxID=1480731 RepID=X2KU63_9CAUD|nr:hypothetical protein HOQ97_gp20 [Vibrio phage Vc1]AHN84671.1 hypothetical protein PV_020 [Vibrio phage Vc1]
MMNWIVLIVLIGALLLSGCAQLPTATGEAAQAVASSEVVTQAGEVGKIVNQDINVPMWMVMVVALVAWCVRTPWGLVSDFLKVRRLG